MTDKKIKTRRRVSLKFKKPSLTKQAPKDECDINNIMARYQKTGQITHLSAEKPNYGFAPSVDFHAAQNLVIKAKETFAALPAKVRARFDNNPAEMLSYIEDPLRTAEEIETALSGIKPPSASKTDEKPATEVSDPLAEPPETQTKETTTKTESSQLPT